MKRKAISIFVLCALCVLLCATAFADTQELIIDDAGLLTDAEETELSSLAASIAQEQSFQVVIVTVYGAGGDIVAYADDLYDNGDYLTDGALLILDMSERAWYISTAGRGIDALSDYNIDRLADTFAPYLSQGEYFESFRVFITECGEYVESYDSGEYVPEDEDYYYYGEDTYGESSRELSPLWIPGSILLGIIAAASTTGVMKGQMNSVKAKTDASDYTKKGSLNLTEKQDTFLYHTVARTPRPRDDDNRSGGGGGNFGGGIHTSGGGVSHGGHGGHF